MLQIKYRSSFPRSKLSEIQNPNVGQNHSDLRHPRDIPPEPKRPSRQALAPPPGPANNQLRGKHKENEEQGQRPLEFLWNSLNSQQVKGCREQKKNKDPPSGRPRGALHSVPHRLHIE